jgi:hypothetical protein
MVPAAADATVPQYDRYAGSPGPSPPVAAAPEAEPAPAPLRPDVSLLGAARRLARRTPVSAGIFAGLGAVVVVTATGLGIGVLDHLAHSSQGCSTGALAGVVQGGCQQIGATNGLLTDWNVALWSLQGVGVAFSAGDGSLVVRIPLGLGMLLTALVLGVAGSVSVRLVAPRRLRDVAVRAGIVAAAYTVGMLIVGVAITARSDRVNVGPDYGLLLLWGLILGTPGSAAGMSRRLFGAALPGMPLALARSRLGRWDGILEAGLVGTAVALVLSAVLGVVVVATHTGDAANVLRDAFLDISTRPLPASALGTAAAVVHLVLALPTLAVWVLAYSLIIPTVTVGTPLGSVDYGLLAGDHDAWLWAVVGAPVVATLVTGYIAARRRGAASVEAALLDGVLGGLSFAVLSFLVVVLLDGGGALSVSSGGGVPGGVIGAGFLFGPGMEYTLGALLLWGVAGGAAGGYLSLLLLARGVGLPLLGRYRAAPPAPGPAAERCPACAAPVSPAARFCSACGAGLGRSQPG